MQAIYGTFTPRHYSRIAAAAFCLLILAYISRAFALWAACKSIALVDRTPGVPRSAKMQCELISRQWYRATSINWCQRQRKRKKQRYQRETTVPFVHSNLVLCLWRNEWLQNNYSDCLLVFAVSGYQTDDKTEARTVYVWAGRVAGPSSDANFPYYLHAF